MKVNSDFKKEYDNQYDGKLEEWRMLGGEDKAANIFNAQGQKVKGSMLDVGSGDGSVLYWLDEMKFCDNVTSVDISESGVNCIKERNETVH